jgi:hypothetical protein
MRSMRRSRILSAGRMEARVAVMETFIDILQLLHNPFAFYPPGKSDFPYNK